MQAAGFVITNHQAKAEGVMAVTITAFPGDDPWYDLEIVMPNGTKLEAAIKHADLCGYDEEL